MTKVLYAKNSDNNAGSFERKQTMDIMTWFNITVVVFTVSGLMAGGLEC